MLNLYEAKTHLSRLVEEAAAGAEIVIAKHGRPRAKLVAVREPRRRRPGSAKGRIPDVGRLRRAAAEATCWRGFTGETGPTDP